VTGASVPLAVGIDVGGTHLRGALVGASGILGDVVKHRSAVDDADALIASVLDLLAALEEGPDGDLPVGLGMAGLVDRAGRLHYGPNVGVTDLDLPPLLREALGGDRVVRVINDATAAVIAEHRLGAGQGYDDLIMLTLGTGVGGGAIVGGRVLEGAEGMAGEFGHLVIARGGRSAPSGIDGTVEAYVSGSAIGQAAQERAMRGEDAEGVTDAPGVVAAACAGEVWAVTLLEEIGEDLGVAIASIAAVLDPALVIVGGGAGQAAATWLLPAARASLRAHRLGAVHRPELPVVTAALGDDAGLIGAALAAADHVTEREGSS